MEDNFDSQGESIDDSKANQIATMHSFTHTCCLRINQYSQADMKTESSKNYSIIVFFSIRMILVIQASLPLITRSFQITLRDYTTAGLGLLLYRTLQILTIITEIIFIGLLVYILSRKRINQRLVKITKLLLGYSDYISEACLAISSLLLAIKIDENLFSYVAAAFIYMLKTLFLQNYTIRKDQFYCSEEISNISLALMLILSCLLSILFNDYLVYAFAMIGQSSIFFGWYFYCGHQLYIHRITQICLRFHVSLYATLTYAVIQSLLIGLMDWSAFSSFMFLPIFFLFFHFHSVHMTQSITEPQSFVNLKTFDLNLSAILQNSYMSANNNSLIIGLLKNHQDKSCYNIDCFSNQRFIYDSVLLEEIAVGATITHKETTFKYFIKCIYEQWIEKQPRNIDLYLDYAQFQLNEFGNSYLLNYLSIKIETLSPNMLQRIRLEKIKSYYQRELDFFNKNLYGGRICLEKIIESEKAYDVIEKKIETYAFEFMSIWKSFKQNQIDLTALKNRIKKCFKLLQQLKESWKIVGQHFNYQKRWLYIYLNYLLFLRNERVPSGLLERFEQGKNEQAIFKPIEIFFQSGSKLNELINESILFHPQSFSLQAIWEREHLVIVKCSQYTERIIGFDKKQLQGCPISIIIPKDIKHEQVFHQWSLKGLSNNQNKYTVRPTEIIHKSGKLIPVYKYYKLYSNISRGLQYVCLLKVNVKDYNIIQLEDLHDSGIRKHKVKSTRYSGLHALITSANDSNLINNFSSNIKFDGWNIVHQNNIFLKEEAALAVEELNQISQIKKSTRIFTFFLMITIGVLAVLTNQESHGLITNSNQYINFMQTYRLPMVLGNNYFKNILGIGNQTKVAAQITSLSKQMEKVSQMPQVLMTVFDSHINHPQKFSPYIVNDINKGYTYDQVQLFYLIKSCISSLSKLPVNRSSQDFQQFNSYIKPGYDQLINGTKNNFHLSMQTLFQDITKRQTIFLIVQGCLFFIFVSLSIYRIQKFFRRLRKIIEIIIELTNEDLTMAYHYWGQIFLFFQNLKIKQKCLAVCFIENSKIARKQQFQMKSNQLAETQSEGFLYRRAKKLIDGKEAIRFHIKLILLVTIGMAVPILLVLICEGTVVNSMNTLIKFENDGFSFLRFFPTATLVGYGCMERYYSYVYPKELTFHPTRYQDVLASMKMVGQFPYIGQVKQAQSPYYQKQRNYFFGNPCQFNPNVLIGVGIDQTKCQTIINGSFSRGLAAYMRAGHLLADSYIHGYSNITTAQLDEFSLSVAVLSGYILDAITTWGTEFNDRVLLFLSNVIVYTIINMCLVTILHVLLFECLVFGQMKQEYRFYRSMYNCMMPAYVLTKQKIVKQKLVSEGIIEG